MRLRAIKVSGVIFDLDGLLFNTEDVFLAAGTPYLQRRGHQFDIKLRNQMMGRPSPISLKLLKEYFSIDDSIEVIRSEVDELFDEYLEGMLALMPGALSLLLRLDRMNLPYAVATSSSREYATALLQRFGLLKRFQFLLGGNDVTNGKPDPEIYLKAADRIGHSPKELLVFEDSGNGCAAAVAAGMNVVAVPNTHNAGQTYDGAYLIADSLNDPRISSILDLQK